ncbi:MAG: diphosphomevalonate decarboxylase [Saprospiraceae bacterium]
MQFTSSWRSPSNIALIKYWGKHGIQLPHNPSLSFTLSECHTNMHMQVMPNASSPGLDLKYDGKDAPAFRPKMKAFFDRLADHLPWLASSAVLIDSVNTFPHGAGIASSASAMSAAALCLADIDDQLNGRVTSLSNEWIKRVSRFARLGSGSACRSVFPIASIWGKTANVEESTDEHAISWSEQVSPLYHDYRDTILIVSSGEKSVSSSAGHELMNSLPYAQTRYAEAKNNIQSLIEIMRTEDRVEEFISICESEALQLHALMMSGKNPYVLIEPNTISIIKEVWQYRKETNIPVCFTLDAGPNVHLLCPASFIVPVQDWVNTTLVQYCAGGVYIPDRTGNGPVKLI